MASAYFAFDNNPLDFSHQEIIQSFENCIDSNINQENNSINGLVSNSLEEIAYELLSSPPSNQFQNLFIKNPQNFYNNNNNNNCLDFSGQFRFNSENVELNNNYFCGDNAMKLMQRSYSSNLIDIKEPNYGFQPSFDCILDSQIRRVYSAGDLQMMKSIENGKCISSNQLSNERFIEEPNLKIARYTAEEKKERIEKYRAKRTQRNFNKKIKYACRKTLADNRIRVRGRFARNDEDIPKSEIFNKFDEENDIWVDRNEQNGVRGPFYDTYGYLRNGDNVGIL